MDSLVTPGGEQFILLDGRILCDNCYTIMKTGRWDVNLPTPTYKKSFPEPEPNAPSVMEKIHGFLQGRDVNADYGRKIAIYKQQKQEFDEKFSRESEEMGKRWVSQRRLYNDICDYWPNLQPPDWQWRRQEAKRRAGNKCERCGQSSDNLHVHHKLPRSQGGNHKPENLIVLCSKCHAREGNPGHEMIQTPRSGDPERERKVVNELKKTALVWKSLKVSDHLICSVCDNEIKKNEKHWECMGWPEDVGKTRVRRGFRGTVSRGQGEAIFIRKARTSHGCTGCGKPILEGDLYFEKNLATFPMRYCRGCCYHRILCNYCDAKYGITRRYRNLVRR